MAQLEPYKQEIEAAGASLAYIAAQKRGGRFRPEEYLKEHPVSFPYLLDEDRMVTKKYGVYVALNVESINIARPATFVIDRAGVVRWVFVGGNQFQRADISQVLEAVRQTSSDTSSKH